LQIKLRNISFLDQNILSEVPKGGWGVRRGWMAGEQKEDQWISRVTEIHHKTIVHTDVYKLKYAE